MDRDLEQVLAPVLEELREIDEEIEQTEKRLAMLKERRTIRKKIAHLIDPEQPPGHGQRKRKAASPGTKSSADYNIAEKTVEEIHAYLVEHYPNGEVFYAGDLYRNGLDFRSEPTINIALRRLHDDGRLQLDSVGNGGRKNYKLIGS